MFNNKDKKPIMVVEADGYAFHTSNPRQLERDRMKDAILAKYNIPILRLATSESGEEARLLKRLADIYRSHSARCDFTQPRLSFTMKI